MKTIFRVSIFTTLNNKTIKNSHFLSYSTLSQQNPVTSHHTRRHEDESRRVRVSVWWDFENCNLQSTTNVFTVGQCITNALRANGIRGPVQITAFGDVMQMSRSTQLALSSTGIIMTHVPSARKNSADRSLLVDLMCWVSQNPPPAHLFLITGDRDFSGILHRLRMDNYNILLAGPDNAPSVLCSAATIMWQWSSLLKGENLSGRLFNYPPDGQFHSMYGQYRASLEDPFAVKEQPSCLSVGESFQPIPEEIMKFINQTLRSVPDGLPIVSLRNKMASNNLVIDKDHYGYKKFSRFLEAMPHIVHLEYKLFGGDNMLWARSKYVDESVPATIVEPASKSEEFEDVIVKSTVSEPKVQPRVTNLQGFRNKNTKKESTSMSTQGIKVKSHETNMQDVKNDEKPKESLPKRSMQETREQNRDVKLQEQHKKVEVVSPIVEIKESSEKNEEQQKKVEVASPIVEIKESSEKNEDQAIVPSRSSESGIVKKIWMKLFGSRDTNSSDQSNQRSDGEVSTEEKSPPTYFSPSNHEFLTGGETAKSDNAVTNVSSHGSGLFNKIKSWFKSSRNAELDDKVEKIVETVGQEKVNSKQLEIFSDESFWKEVESFLDTFDGLATLIQSRTRKHLVQNLQKNGPPIVKSLPESCLLQLVDLLIKDKKWVEERGSQTFPFRLTRPAGGKDPNSNLPSSSNGLSNIFARRRANLQDSGERKHVNPHTGVPQLQPQPQPQPAAHGGFSSKPRSEMLADIQKLVDHILKEHPEGYNMGCFRQLFLKKNGYPLDLQKIGYEKLVNLLQIMPGVRIESSLIYPAAALKNLDAHSNDYEDKVCPVTESSPSVTKEDDSDSPWNELGPVNKDKTNSVLTSKGSKGKPDYDYEPVGLEDLSDSDEEATSSRSVNITKSGSGDESSLLHILDSWYSKKEVDGKKKDGTVSITSAEKKESSLVINPTKKQKPVKSYSFVTEPDDNMDKLLDIFSSTKKSGEKSSA